MLAEDWQAPENRCVGLLLAGDAIEPMPVPRTGQPDDSVLLILNAQPQAIAFVLPALQGPASGRGCCVRLILSSLPPRPSLRARSTPCQPGRSRSYGMREERSASGRA